MSERIEEITSEQKRKKKLRFSMIILLIMSVFTSTLTALAYSPAEHIQVDENMPIEEAKSLAENGVFVPKGKKSIYLEDDTIGLVKPGKYVFKDEDGGVYYFDKDEDSLKIDTCNHSYINGQYYKHSDKEVGCIVKVYAGKYCSNCNGVATEKEVCRREYFVECPH